MGVILWVLFAAINIFMLVMWIRLIFDFVQSFNREWRPRGFSLLVAEVAYTVTDPPIKLLRRVLPPLRFGAVALDLSWTIVMLAAIVLSFFVSNALS